LKREQDNRAKRDHGRGSTDDDRGGGPARRDGDRYGDGGGSGGSKRAKYDGGGPGRGGRRWDGDDGRGNGGGRRQQQSGTGRGGDGDNYYGPGGGDGAGAAAKEGGEAEESPKEKEKPNFALSGALAKGDTAGTGGGAVYKGVALKFSEPPEARAPNKLWRLYVYKGDEQIETLHINKQSAYLIGRNDEIADIALQHPSISSQHAVIQYRALPDKNHPEHKLNCQPYLLDLESTNGSFINGVRVDAARYYQLKKGDVLKFGASTREYVLLSADSTTF